jgi:hypothetical protein
MTATVSFLAGNQLWQHGCVEKMEFAYGVRKDGSVAISWRSRTVKVITGSSAIRFLDRISRPSPSVPQLKMARVAGSFKRGNERQQRERRARSEE